MNKTINYENGKRLTSQKLNNRTIENPVKQKRLRTRKIIQL